jgi:pimeloyl-ACP methyl ester carboxylesterase
VRPFLSLAILLLAVSAQAAAPTRHQVMADGHPLALWEKHPTSPRATLLLVHGRTWSALPNFDLQVPDLQRSVLDAFVSAGYAAYALDLRGYGATPRDSTGWLTPDRAVEDVRIALEWIRKAHPKLSAAPALVGYSRGSFITLLTAKRHPDAVSALVLYGFPGVPPPPRPDPKPADPPRVANTAKAAAADFITPGAASQAVIDAYVRQALATNPIRVDWREEEHLVDDAPLRVPTLMIDGANDPFLRLENREKFVRLEGHESTEVVLPSSDHAAHIENSHEAWVRAIVGFIERRRIL